MTFVILLGGGCREREWRPARVRPKPEIGRIDATVIPAIAEQVSEIANQAVQGLCRLAPPPVAHTLGVEEHDQVEPARISELPRAESADTEHGQPARCRRLVLVREGKHAARRCRTEKMIQSGGEDRLRQPGEGSGHPLERPGAGDVGECDGERRPSLGRAQPRGECATVAAPTGAVRNLVEGSLERSVGAAFGHDAKLSRFAAQRPAEGRAVAEYAIEESAGTLIFDQGGCERPIGTALRDGRRQPGLPPGTRVVGRDRLGMHRIVIEERQERHRGPIVLQGSARGRAKRGPTGAAGAAVSGSST